MRNQILLLGMTSFILISSFTNLPSQVDFQITRISDTEMHISASGSLNSPEPTQYAYLMFIQSSIDMTNSVGGTLVVSNNTLEVGGIPVTQYILNSNGNIGFNSDGTHFPINGIITGSVEILVVGGGIIKLMAL